MISSIQLRSFKGHRDTTVPLGRLTVLVGPNGTGKTSVLQALSLMARLMNEQAENVLRGDMSPQDLLRRSEQGPITLTSEGTYEAHPWMVSLRFPQPVVGHQQGLRLHWSYGENTGDVLTIGPPVQKRLVSLVSPAVLYHFDARRIAAASYSSEENPALDPDGSNTAVVLAALKLDREEVFEQIESELRRIVPGVQRIRVRRVRVPNRSATRSSSTSTVPPTSRPMGPAKARSSASRC